MPFLALPPEIRVMIYSLLLCLDGPIRIDGVKAKPNYVPRIRYVERKSTMQRSRIYTAILHVNKTVYIEAVPVLYSRNLFQICNIHLAYLESSNPILGPSTNRFSWSYVPFLAPFLGQIGANARLLRHIGLKSPEHLIDNYLFPELAKAFQLLRDSCPGLKTIKIIAHLPPPPAPPINYVIKQDAKLFKAMDDCALGAMPSVESITVIYSLLFWRARNPYKEDAINLIMNNDDSLSRRLPSCKWSVEVVPYVGTGVLETDETLGEI
ncbi:hypothetical protein B0T21DRAFT_415949 [Apiosordaria backusii]|uniref:Uncharacterized protein n=1 Tax=Apiosordaria backusii TaxID=314023 RepID=A0AA40DP34_9PEZI|nr:hypothetical protein B0T21DRAFT_415949 [Apiosordaria backusii]